MYSQLLIRFWRLCIFVLICLGVAFCLIAVLRAQAWLNHQAELSGNPIEAEPQTSTKSGLLAANGALRFAGQGVPFMTLVEVGHTGMGVFSQEHIGSMAEDVGHEAFAEVRPTEPVRSTRSPEPVQPITPSLVSAEGKKADDDVHLTPVSVHRFGGRPTVYRVPKE